MNEKEVTDDDVEKMVNEIYKQADLEVDESTLRMLQNINKQANRERRESATKRPSDVLLESHQRAMKTIEENQALKRSESPPSTEFSSGRSNDRSSRSGSISHSYSRDSGSYSGSRSTSYSRNSRSYSGSKSPYSHSREDSRSYSGSRSYSRSTRSDGSKSYHSSERSPSPGDSGRSHSSRSHSSRGSRSTSRSGSRSYYSEEVSPGRDPEQDEMSDEFAKSDDDSTLSEGNPTRRRNCAIGIIVCLLIAAGLGIGFGISIANKEDPLVATPPATPPPNNSGVGDGTILLDAKDYFLFGAEQVTDTTTIDLEGCLDFCKDYDAMQYLYVQDTCTCYNSVTCLMPWGLQVDYRFVGDLYIKDELEECSEDYCQALDGNDGLCFTANSRDYKEYSFYGENLEERLNRESVETLEECLDLCAPYDAASYLNYRNCTCYNEAECWLDWGQSVDTQLLLGTVFSKKPLDVCAETYCQANADPSCFSANRKNAKVYTVFGTALDSTTASSEDECLEICAQYDAASFLRPNICTCFENPTCWLEWGENVDTQLFFGNIFSKTPLDVCESDYCEVNTEDSLCFTANVQDCRDYALYGDSLFETARQKTGDLQACLDMCASYDAAAFTTSEKGLLVSGLHTFEDCGCYNFAQCWLRWGDEVDSEDIIGTIYSKKPLQECERDYCDTVAPDGLCFTGNTQSYSNYSLFGDNLEEVGSINNVTSKEECLDFCKRHDAAQFLEFQDPKCKCFSGAECWLAWSNGTDTTGALYTGDAYSKKELQYCSR